MPVYVALLRGVNVGKAKRVPMADLRVVLAGLACTERRDVVEQRQCSIQVEGPVGSGCAAVIARASPTDSGSTFLSS